MRLDQVSTPGTADMRYGKQHWHLKTELSNNQESIVRG